MEGNRASPSQPAEESQRSPLLSDEDLVTKLARRQAVQNDVQKALASLASTLSSVQDHDDVIRTVRRRFDEREDACAKLARVTEEIRAEKENRAKFDQAQSDREASLHDEIGQLHHAVRTAEEDCANTQREAEHAKRAAEQEITRLRETVGSAEKEAAEWQLKANAGESRLESMTVEVGALHEAMAGLHGEMGAVQRELDSAKSSQDKLTMDLSKAEGRHRKSQEECEANLERAKGAEKGLRKETAEKTRISTELDRLVQESKKVEVEKSALMIEIKRLKESEDAHRNSSDKLNTTNRELNALLQQLSAELEDAKSKGESNSKRADASALEVGLRDEEGRRIKEALAAIEARLEASDREKNLLKGTLSKAAADLQTKTAEVDRQRGELDLLEREKHDLILDVQERLRVQKEATAEAERCQARVEEAEKRLKDGESSKLAAEISKKKILDELNDAKRGTAMQDERIEVLRSELTSLRRSLEQTTEAAKLRDRESAQRLVQLSQANAKLSSDSSSARAQLVGAEESSEKAKQELEDALKSLSRSEEQGRRAAESVQRLEEELEVADARWKAAQGQLDDAIRREKRSAEEAREKLREALESKKKELEAAVREAETHAQRRSMEADADRRAVERNHERALDAVREEAKKKIAEGEAKRVREVSDERRKSKAVVEALQTLQDELRNSEAKGSGLERQVSQLSARMTRAGTSSATVGGGSGGGYGGGVGDGSSLGGIGGVGREGNDGTGSSARGAEVTEAEIASLRRQMKAATQAKESAQRSALGARSCAEEEIKKRSALEDSLCRKESEMLALLERLDALKLRQQEVEERGREAEEDLRSLVRQRESEIESLTRRNQVLNGALSRLTSSDGYPVDAGTASNKTAFSATIASGGATVVPAIPQLIDASLRDSWKTDSAPSFSPAFGGATGNSALGLEASLSVLADASAGFEPPSPPTVESDVDHRHRVHVNHNGANKGRVESNNENTNRDRRNASNSSELAASVDGSRNRRNRDGSEEGNGSLREDPIGRAGSGDRADGGGGRRHGSGGHHSSDDCGNEGSDRRHQAIVTTSSDGDNRRSTNEHGITTAMTNSSSSSTMGHEARRTPIRVGKSRGDMELLQGVSAAVASGALPMTRSNPNLAVAANRSKSTWSGGLQELPGDRHDGSSNHLPHIAVSDDTKGVGSRSDTGESHEMTSIHIDGSPLSDGGAEGGRHVAEERMEGDSEPGDRGGGQTLGRNWHQDDAGEQARRQIDQALRERALRRRNSDAEALLLPRKDYPTRRARSSNMDASATAVNLALPTRARLEFHTSASSSNILNDIGDGAQFINLGAMVHRASSRGSKQGLPGRGGGSRPARARLAAGGAQTVATVGGAVKKSAAARAYGMPQGTR